MVNKQIKKACNQLRTRKIGIETPPLCFLIPATSHPSPLHDGAWWLGSFQCYISSGYSLLFFIRPFKLILSRSSSIATMAETKTSAPATAESTRECDNIIVPDVGFSPSDILISPNLNRMMRVPYLTFLTLLRQPHAISYTYQKSD